MITIAKEDIEVIQRVANRNATSNMDIAKLQDFILSKYGPDAYIRQLTKYTDEDGYALYEYYMTFYSDGIEVGYVGTYDIIEDNMFTLNIKFIDGLPKLEFNNNGTVDYAIVYYKILD